MDNLDPNGSLLALSEISITTQSLYSPSTTRKVVSSASPLCQLPTGDGAIGLKLSVGDGAAED